MMLKSFLSLRSPRAQSAPLVVCVVKLPAMDLPFRLPDPRSIGKTMSRTIET